MYTGRLQEPEHKIIIDYVRGLIDEGDITLAKLARALPEIYLEMIPPGRQQIRFEAIHRHDPMEEAERKYRKNRKELERIILEVTRFPLSLRNPLIQALEEVSPGHGLELHRRLVRNQGLLYLPIDLPPPHGEVGYSVFISRFSEANQAVVDDIAADHVLDDSETRHALLALLEQVTAMVRAIDDARTKEGGHG